MADGEEENNSIRVCGMQFSYEGQTPIFADFNLNIQPGSRCLLVGANGSGNQSINQSILSLLLIHSLTHLSINWLETSPGDFSFESLPTLSKK